MFDKILKALEDMAKWLVLYDAVVPQVFLLEFNTSPVLKDPKDSPETNDGAMIEAALGIVFPWEVRLCGICPISPRLRIANCAAIQPAEQPAELLFSQNK